MSARVILRPRVPDDLTEIIVYHERHGVTSPNSFIDCASAAINDVAARPGMGSLKNLRGRGLKGLRSWSIPEFPKILILYRPIEDGIEVLAVLHGARNTQSVLAKRVRDRK